jgi:hypothetical protein
MSWWHWYLIAGLLVYGVALIWDRYVTVWRPPHVTLLGKLINAGVEILTLCVFTVAWPIVLVVQIRDMKTYTDNPPARFKKFKVSKRQLTKQLSVQEVERLEIVNDPLGCVPNVPFGFLNQAWHQFLANLSPMDTLWAFSAQEVSGFTLEEREGYAIVRFGWVRRTMLTSRTTIGKNGLVRVL